MPTRVTPYLGGTGQDNTRKLNVHSSLNRVSIGADVLASANLDVFGNTFVRGNVETANTFVSTSNSNTPLQAFVGETAGGRWLNKGGSSAFAWYSDTLVTPVTGFTSLTYYGTTFYPKIVFGSLGDISVAGKFATNAAQINRDGTASFGSLTVPSLNTVGITGNVYISGNLFVGGNSYQIISNITQAVGNVVTANAYVVTRLLGLTDIPMSNGITFSNANLVISAYANPVINFSPNNNVWISSNIAVIGKTAAAMAYNPYSLVHDGLVVMHSGVGPTVQTWVDGVAGTSSRAWSLGLGQFSAGDMTLLVGTAANTRPSIIRFSIDQNGNTRVGTGSITPYSNLTVIGNASVSSNLIVGGNVVVGAPTNYDALGLSDKLTIVPPAAGTVAQIPFAFGTGNATYSNQRYWGFGVNQHGQGNMNIMVSLANNTRPSANVMSFSRVDLGVTANANLTVQGNLWVNGDAWVTGNIASHDFSRANALNEAAVAAACISRGWPIPAFGLMALPDIDPPGGMVFARSSTAWRFNKNRILEEVPTGTIRHEYDLETGEYLGWAFSGTAGKVNPFVFSNNLSVTGRLTVSGVSGTFIEGEYINDGSNTGVYIVGDSTYYGVAGNSGIMSGTLTGNTSLATATITAYDAEWISNNMIVASNAIGLDNQSNHASYLEAAADNATIEQNIIVSNATRTGVLYIKRLAGTGNINVSFNGTTWLPLLDKQSQEDTFTLNSNHFIETRFSGASGVNPNVRIRLETAGDKIVVGNMYVGGNDFSYNPIINGPLTPTAMASENLRFPIGCLTPGEDFTMYVRAHILQPTVASYIATLSNGTSTANTAYLYNNGGILQFRYTHQNAANIATVPTSRDLTSTQELTLVGRIKEGTLTLYGNDRLYAINVGNNISHTTTLFDRLCLGERGDQSTTGGGNYIFKEAMIWSSALDDETMRLIGNGSKNAIPRPFIENAGQMRSVIQTLTKLKNGGTGTISIECAGDSYGTGASGTASWPYHLAKYLDTTYSNNQAAVGWMSGGSTIGPANSDAMGVSYTVGSWTQTTRTEVSPNLGVSSTASSGGYVRYVAYRDLGIGAAARFFYITNADGQAEYSWDDGATRFPLDLTVGTIGEIGYYDLGSVPTGTVTLRIYRASGTIKIAGVNFTNTNSGVVIHKMCNTSGEAQDWYHVNSTQWKIGYELINPTASIIMLGAYDQAAYYNEKSFAYYLQDMISRRRATVTNRPIMIVMPPDNRRSNTSPMDFYSREARRIASLNNCTFVDLQWLFGNNVAEYDLSWWSDTIIPNLAEGGPALVAGIIRALENAGT